MCVPRANARSFVRLLVENYKSGRWETLMKDSATLWRGNERTGRKKKARIRVCRWKLLLLLAGGEDFTNFCSRYRNNGEVQWRYSRFRPGSYNEPALAFYSHNTHTHRSPRVALLLSASEIGLYNTPLAYNWKDLKCLNLRYWSPRVEWERKYYWKRHGKSREVFTHKGGHSVGRMYRDRKRYIRDARAYSLK